MLFVPFKPSGPHDVGLQDLEYCSSSSGGAVDCHTHLVGRLFYPAAQTTQARPLDHLCTWIPHWIYAYGKQISVVAS
jgi:hypothetical protein